MQCYAYCMFWCEYLHGERHDVPTSQCCGRTVVEQFGWTGSVFTVRMKLLWDRIMLSILLVGAAWNEGRLIK